MIAALFVTPGGCYFNLPNVDPWDEIRDARQYPGPFSVVAHPPCARWSILAYVNLAKYLIPIGEDGDCFKSALNSVRTYGGVLEHPALSMAWDRFDIRRPVDGLWRQTKCGGWTTEVSQRNYGHLAIKKTWLYYQGKVFPPKLRWGILNECSTKGTTVELMSKKQRIQTPIEFRDLLISIAEEAR